jgi:hypothetical protein
VLLSFLALKSFVTQAKPCRNASAWW